ncbi:histidine phosphatase family protein [Paenibacillus sp. MWE-103]|uniref:Histidine phosphatase family protein n=1 Tax=Paenibacillus artemisiicola TaxID=1172618 RepID=A0ABS3WIY9_9BACL|nr:histidine phosphatase family protein [Paenibacillus artemisiicola]MBO7748294.1 histidine phosphatase family protein [Paenibacillus artemisiicola]
MNTTLLLVRHAESDARSGPDRERGLTAKGREDAALLTDKLRGMRIDAVASSPYARAVLTVRGLADERGLAVHVLEELRERRLHGEDAPLPREAFLAAVRRSFADPDAVLPGGESFREAQARGLGAVHRLLGAHRGGTAAVGTHGNLMAMILRAYDARCDFAFWERLAMPDVYRLDFEHDELRGVERLWN